MTKTIGSRIMIYVSLPWKNELKRIKKYLESNSLYDKNGNTNEIKIFHFEKNLFISAFIIRKLIESDKMSDYIDNLSIKVKAYKPKKHIDKLHCYIDEDEYNWKNVEKKVISIKDISNYLIHSYVFNFSINDENYKCESFFVSSDYDRNKYLYEIQMKDWYKVLDKVSSDSITRISRRFKEKNDDYVSIKKVCGVKKF